MKLRTISMLLSISLLMGMTFSGCSANNTVVANKETANPHIEFTDDLGREVIVTSAEKVGIASGSFVDCWLLAGGTPTAVTQDAFEERNLNLPEDVINLGALSKPSMEIILSSELDFLILSASLKPHIALADTLEKAGVPHAYMEIETFEDYLDVMKIFTDITGREDLYKQNCLNIKADIDTILNNSKISGQPNVLVLRTSASKISARNSDTMVGQMLKNLGCNNIADAENSLLEELSLEVIAQQNPDYIFVICRGDTEEAKATMENLMYSNPVWHTLDAVKNDRCIYLEKELFHYKPNARWGESYEVLAEILSEN